MHNLTQTTMPIEIEGNTYNIKTFLGWYDKDIISSAYRLVPIEDEQLKKQVIKLKEEKGLKYTTEENYNTDTHFSDKELLTFQNATEYTLTKLMAYIYSWVRDGKHVSITQVNIKLIPRHHFNLIIEKIREVESQSEPFQGESESKG
jgi:hypothetical protein